MTSPRAIPFFFVIPAKAGIQGNRAMSFAILDPRLRGDDGSGI